MAKKKSKVAEFVGRFLLGITKGALHIVVTILFYALVVFALYQLAGLTYKYAYQVTGSQTVAEAPGTDQEITVTKGEATMKIATELFDKGIVLNKYTFYIRAKLNRKTPIIPGTYTVNSSMTYDDILTILAGKTLDT